MLETTKLSNADVLVKSIMTHSLKVLVGKKVNDKKEVSIIFHLVLYVKVVRNIFLNVNNGFLLF